MWDVKDLRSRNAIVISEKFAAGIASVEELDAAWRAAYRASWSAALSAALSTTLSAAWSAALRAADSAARAVQSAEFERLMLEAVRFSDPKLRELEGDNR